MDENKDQRPGITLTSDKKLEDGKEKKTLNAISLPPPSTFGSSCSHASQTPTQPQRWIIEKPHLLEGTTCQCQM